MGAGNISAKDADVIVKVAIEMQKATKNADKQIKAAVKGQGKRITSALNKEINKATSQQQMFKKKNFEMRHLMDPAQFKAVKAEYAKLGRTVGGKLLPNYERLNLAGKKVSTNMSKQAKAVKMNKKEFSGWALSLMFAGMALKGIFDTIWKSSTKTFNEVMHSVEGTVTGFDMMQGAMAYVGYAAGAAFEPIADFLTPIIWAVADWISENEKLFAGLTLTSGILGTMFMVGGMVALAVDGFKNLGAEMGLVTMEAGKITNYNWKAMGSKIKNGIGLIGIGFGLYQIATAFKDFESGKFSNGFIRSISGAVSTIGGIMIMRGSPAGGPLLVIGVAMELLAQDKFFQTMALSLGWLNALFMTTWDRVKHDYSKKVGDGIIQETDNLITKLAKIWNKLFPESLFSDLLNSLAGIERETAGVFDGAQSFKDNYAKVIQSGISVDSDFSAWKTEIDFGVFFPDKDFDKVSKKISYLEQLWGKDFAAIGDDMKETFAKSDLEYLSKFSNFFDINTAALSNLQTVVTELENAKYAAEELAKVITGSDIAKADEMGLIGRDEVAQLLNSGQNRMDAESIIMLQEIMQRIADRGESSAERTVIIQNLDIQGVQDMTSLLDEIARLT